MSHTKSGVIFQCHRPILTPCQYSCGRSDLLASIVKIFRVSNSGFPTQYSFDQISNEIPCVNIFLQFLTTLDFELQIRNHHCTPNSQQDNIITFILTFNINTFLYYYASSLPRHPGHSLVYLTELKYL